MKWLFRNLFELFRNTHKVSLNVKSIIESATFRPGNNTRPELHENLKANCYSSLVEAHTLWLGCGLCFLTSFLGGHSDMEKLRAKAYKPCMVVLAYKPCTLKVEAEKIRTSEIALNHTVNLSPAWATWVLVSNKQKLKRFKTYTISEVYNDLLCY